uniref:Uncharacterized protein n=1 Tax=Pavo cristatus TaxID=9049 RepID=A0A8C9FWK9_PAVCR
MTKWVGKVLADHRTAGWAGRWGSRTAAPLPSTRTSCTSCGRRSWPTRCWPAGSRCPTTCRWRCRASGPCPACSSRCRRYLHPPCPGQDPCKDQCKGLDRAPHLPTTTDLMVSADGRHGGRLCALCSSRGPRWGAGGCWGGVVGVRGESHPAGPMWAHSEHLVPPGWDFHSVGPGVVFGSVPPWVLWVVLGSVPSALHLGSVCRKLVCFPLNAPPVVTLAFFSPPPPVQV